MKTLFNWVCIVVIIIYPFIVTKFILDRVESRIDTILSAYEIIIE